MLIGMPTDRRSFSMQHRLRQLRKIDELNCLSINQYFYRLFMHVYGFMLNAVKKKYDTTVQG